MFVLLKADEIVKPPISNMIVGENIAEKTDLKRIFKSNRLYINEAYFAAAGGAIWTPSLSRMTWNKTRSNGTSNEVTKSGIACFILWEKLKGASEALHLGCPKNRTQGKNSKAAISFSTFDHLRIQ